jgi:hypothetical protein
MFALAAGWATAKAQAATITGVSVAGQVSAPVVTVRGSGFGTQPSADPAGCGASGSDFAGTALSLENVTSHLWTPGGTWFAGLDGDCVGLTVRSYTPTKIVFGFGSDYGEVPGYLLEEGDRFTVTVNGAARTAVAHYPGDSTTTGRVLALLEPALSGIAPGVPHAASDGVYLEKLGGPVLAASDSTFAFEPASSIKVVIALYAMSQVAKGALAITQPIPHYEEKGYPCPTAPSEVLSQTPLWRAIQEMMYYSNNWYTRDLEQYFGVGALNTFLHTLGVQDTSFATSTYPPGFNVIGIDCAPTYPPPNPVTLDENKLTLADATIVWRAAHELPAPYSSEFSELVVGTRVANDTAGDSGGWDRLKAIAAQEAPAAMSASDLQSFYDHMSTNDKGGDYYWGLTAPGWGRQWHVLTGITEVPTCTGGFVSESSYAWGYFVSAVDESGGHQIGAAMGAAEDELQREVIRDALRTWKRCAPPPDPAISAVGVIIGTGWDLPYNGPVARVVDDSQELDASELKASIGWGDGTPAQIATVTGGPHEFTVWAWRPFNEAIPRGLATVTVSDTDPAAVAKTVFTTWMP